jgi:hypothetical protein
LKRTKLNVSVEFAGYKINQSQNVTFSLEPRIIVGNFTTEGNMTFEPKTIVTLQLHSDASNTFIVDTVEEETLLLSHPLTDGILIRVPKSRVNNVAANIKNSTERSIDFANQHRKYIPQPNLHDLDSIGLYFAIYRKLSPLQKKTISNMCGLIARESLQNNIEDAKRLILKNSSMLDEFNTMWFNNFLNLLTGKLAITSEKQRMSIFNMAGFILAEMENPVSTSPLSV